MRKQSLNIGQGLSPSARRLIMLRQRAFNNGGASLEIQTPTNYIRDISRKLNYDITRDLPQRNLLQWSEDFTNAIWGKPQLTLTANATNDIYGNLTATRFNEITTNNRHNFYQNINVISGNAYTTSIYFKKYSGNVNERQYAYNEIVTNSDSDNRIVVLVDLNNGTVVDVKTQTVAGLPYLSYSYNVVDSGSYWRVIITAIPQYTGIMYQVAGLSNSATPTYTSSEPTYTGDVTKFIYAWGAQLEQGSIPTSYQKTQTSSTDDGASLIMTPNTIGEGKLFNCKPDTLRNLLQRSEEFDNIYWTKTSSSISANSTTDPNGNSTADKLLGDTSNTSHRVSTILANTTIGFYTASVYVKSAEVTEFAILMSDESGSDTYAIYNLTSITSSTTIIGTSWNTVTSSITNVGSGWYRCILTANKLSGSNVGFRNYLISGGNFSFIGSATSGLYIWGIQLEKNSIATTYQRTTDGIIDFQATRATTANVVRKDGTVGDSCYNLLQYSEDFTNAVWNKNDVSIASNATTNPVGVNNAQKIVCNTNTPSFIRVYQALTSSSSLCNYSFYVKKEEFNFLHVRLAIGTQQGFCLNLTTASFTQGYYDGTTASINIPTKSAVIDSNGWIKVTFATNSANGGGLFFYPSNVATSTNNTGQLNNGLYIWGVQQIQDSIPPTKDYLKTTNRLAVPSIDYSLGSSLPVLLVEPQRTNIVLQSENYSDVNWVKVNGTISTDSTINPAGIPNSYLYSGTTVGANSRQLYRGISGANGIYTLSFYVKKGINRYAFSWDLTNGSVATIYDMNTTTTTNYNTNYTSTMKSVSNGWFYCTLTSTVNITPNFVVIGPSESNNTFGGSNLPCSIYIWGIQIEQASNPTSYIPTTTTSVTRNAYTSYVDLWNNSLLNKDNFTLFFEGYLQGNVPTNVMVALSDTTGLSTRSNDIGVFDGCKATYAVGNTVTSDTVNLLNNRSFKIAIVRNGSSVKWFMNGFQVWSTQTITSFDYRYLVTNTGGSTYNLKKLALWKHSKSDSDAVTLTSLEGLNTNLIAYYAFENNLIDKINGNNGTSSGTGPITYNSGIIGFSMEKPFNGFMTIPNSTNLDFSNTTNDLPFSISFWYMKNDAATRTIFNKRGGNASNDQYSINIITGFAIEVTLFSNSTSAYLRRTYNATVSNNIFYHIVVTYNGSGSSSGIKIYFNGVLQTSTDSSIGTYTKMPISNQVERIGTLWDGTLQAGYFRLDELAIWKNRELTTLEVSQLYNSNLGYSYPF